MKYLIALALLSTGCYTLPIRVAVDVNPIELRTEERNENVLCFDIGPSEETVNYDQKTYTIELPGMSLTR